MWKVWTPEAVLRAAFMPATQSGRAAAAAVGGAGPGHARACRDVVARCIEAQQQRGLRRLRAEASGSEGRPLKFLIRNCMWDETQLSLKLSGQPLADHSVLAQHMQVTWCTEAGCVTDADLVRPPVVLADGTAATMWSALTCGGDPIGLALGQAVLPAAGYHGLLTTCDGSAANRLLVKHIAEQASGAGGTTLQLACFCAQHSTGAVIEGVTRRLGILTPTFNTALSLKRASFQRRVREEIRRLLVERLVIMAELPAAPADGHSRALLAEFFFCVRGVG